MSGKTLSTKPPAKSARHRARELALQGIYQWRLSGNLAEQIAKQIAEEKGLGRYDTGFYAELLHGVLAESTELLAAVAPYLDRPVDELSPIEYSVLLLAAYELMHLPQIPYRVVINEAVELAKSYGGTDGYKYVNGVLDKLAAQVRTIEFVGGDSR